MNNQIGALQFLPSEQNIFLYFSEFQLSKTHTQQQADLEMWNTVSNPELVLD